MNKTKAWTAVLHKGTKREIPARYDYPNGQYSIFMRKKDILKRYRLKDIKRCEIIIK